MMGIKTFIGYLYDVPFLHESCGIKIRNGKVIEPLYKGFINISYPTMCFIGLLQRTFIFPVVDLQVSTRTTVKVMFI